MAITIADQYYIKALDGYPYNMEESIENLDYALSYDAEHTGALYLMGCLCMDQLEEYEKAESYFQTAMSINPSNNKLVTKYAILMVYLREFDKAKNLIDYNYKIKGADLATNYRVESLLNEYQHQYEKAISLLEMAQTEAYNREFLDLIDDDIIRIKEKQTRKKHLGLTYLYV